jgi:hypothetical protein
MKFGRVCVYLDEFGNGCGQSLTGLAKGGMDEEDDDVGGLCEGGLGGVFASYKPTNSHIAMFFHGRWVILGPEGLGQTTALLTFAFHNCKCK